MFKLNKRSQSEVITTILIILLVIGVVVIVWQVINRTVTTGAKKIEQQALCLDLVIEVTKVDIEKNLVTIRPSKDINGYRVYVNGEEAAPEGKALKALGTDTVNSTVDIVAGSEIEVVGKFGDNFCTTGTKKTVS